MNRGIAVHILKTQLESNVTYLCPCFIILQD